MHSICMRVSIYTHVAVYYAHLLYIRLNECYKCKHMLMLRKLHRLSPAFHNYQTIQIPNMLLDANTVQENYKSHDENN